MAKVEHQIQRSNRGVFSPLLDGRTDLEFFQDSLIKCENMIPSVYGPSLKRGGSIFAYGSKDNAGCHLIPFVAGIGSSYILEFGDEYIRFYKDGAILMADALTVYELKLPYTLAEITNTDGSLKLSYTQSIDVMDLTLDGKQSYQLKRYGDTDWVLQETKFINGPYDSLNSDDNISLQYNAVPANSEIGKIVDLTIVKTLPTVLMEDYVSAPFVDTITLSEALNLLVSGITPNRYDISLDSVSVTGTFSGTTPIQKKNELLAKVNELSNATAIMKDDYDTIKVKGSSGAVAGKDVVIQLIWYTTLGGAIATATCTEELDASVISDEFSFDISDIGKDLRIFNENSDTKYWITNEAVTADSNIRYSDNKYYLAKTSATTGTQKPNHTEGIVSDGTVSWEYLHAGDGYGTIVEFTSNVAASILIKSRLPVSENVSSGTVTSSLFQVSVFGGSDDIFPLGVDYYRERKVLFANTNSGPFAFFSVAGDYNNYSDRSFGEILTESAVSIGLTGKQLNEIKWTNSNFNLFIGTAGAEHIIGPQTQSEPFGPDNVRTTIVSNIGGKQLKSQTMTNNIVFIDRTGKSIRNMKYDNSSETGNPEDISIFAKHLFRNGVKSWAWQYEPYKVLWCVTQDGKLIGFTFNQEQDVIAFHEHKTNGTFESIASIPSSDGENDELWAVVNRTIDGSTVRYIEYFYNTLTGLSNTIFDGSDDEEDNIDSYFQVNGIYCDSAVKTYNATAFSTVDGLDHLEGEEVVVLGDGMPQTVKTVTDGEITLDSEVNTAIVGLAYSSILQPRAINAGSSSGVSIGKTQRINKLNLQLHKSASFKAGDALDNLQYYSIRKNSSVMGSPVPLFTGFKEIVFNGESEVGPDCFIVSDKPTMLNIVSITYEVSTGD